MRRALALVTAAILALAAAPPAAAQGRETASSMSRMALFQSQTRLLDRRGAVQYEGSARLRPRAELTDRIPAYSGRATEWMDPARAAARRHAVPEDLFLRLVQTESNWNPGAVSHKGATGLAQLMPETARLVRVADILDPAQNLDGGARYLRMMYDRFGTWRLALAAYNAGPGAVEQHGGVPPFAETQAYVRRILGE